MDSFKSSIASTRLAPLERKLDSKMDKDFPKPAVVNVQVNSVTSSDDGNEAEVAVSGPKEDWQGAYKFAPIKVREREWIRFRAPRY